jgi:Glycosyl hydrolase family 12/Cellulose binding domain
VVNSRWRGLRARGPRRSGPRHPRLFAPAAAVAVVAAAAALTLLPATAHAASTTLCTEQTGSVSGGAYIVQNNEYDSSATECVTTDGNADFSVASSGISNSTSGSPGSYPSIYKGCHWGLCTSGSGLPIQVSSMATGDVTSSWSTTQTGSGAYDVAYDIWYNQTPTTAGQPNGTEIMIWLNHNGSVQPFGSEVASNVSIGGKSYNVWEGGQSSWDTVSYSMTTGTTSVSNLDIDQITQDAVNRGYLQKSWYLIDVEAGFELWQGGAGLATNSFSVAVNSGSTTPPTTTPPTTTPPTTPPPTTTPPTTPPPTTTGGSGCSAVYTITNAWSTGYQGQVAVTNNGSSTTGGWKVTWTYPSSGEVINDLWSGTYTQSGTQVSVVNANYDGSLAPGAGTTFGFTGTDTGSDAAPATLTCTAS